MANFDCVPVVIVTRENIKNIWPCLVFFLKNSSFVAVDLELSGLGNRRELNAKSVEDRYKAIVEITRTRAIISLGLSCFLETHSQEDETEAQAKRYQVQTFNLMCLCSENYTVEPESLKFLVRHGFDFNRQYSSGISYYRGSDKTVDEDGHLRKLFLELLTGQRPLVLHNGFVDLVFLYGSLYCSLPTSLASFLADVEQMFPKGIYDTKYLAEFRQRLSASFLEYVFKKSQYNNWECSTTGRPCIKLAFMSYPDDFLVEFCHCKLRKTSQNQPLNVCKYFASHGWCSKGENCEQSHNIDDVLGAEILKKLKQKKKRKKGISNGPIVEDMVTEESVVQENGDKLKTELAISGKQTAGCHRAGYDAFMTGFIFASYLAGAKNLDEDLQELKNKLYLCGKDVPLLIVASKFAKPTAEHLSKFKNKHL